MRQGGGNLTAPDLFQSAPPCGGRPASNMARGTLPPRFQSAPPCGGRRESPTARRLWIASFNPRPRAGGDQVGVTQAPTQWVSIRAPVRGATCRFSVPCRCPTLFQSAPPCGGRPDSIDTHSPVDIGFNPRPRAGGDVDGVVFAITYEFQSAPPCGGRLYLSVAIHISVIVSIRAPVRGATRGQRHQSGIWWRFNPRPRAGGDLDHRCAPHRDRRRFNPRPRAGGDDRPRQRLASRTKSFNPRPRAGGDPSALPGTRSTSRWFQSAPPCGGRQFDPYPRSRSVAVSIRAPVRGATQAAQSTASNYSFNPRPRAGGDLASGLTGVQTSNEFQSAPPCGGRLSEVSPLTRCPFQSAPPCGGRLAALGDEVKEPKEFQSAPPCGGRRPPRQPGRTDGRFNPRPRAGGDPTRLTLSSRSKCFNPRPRAGGDLTPASGPHASTVSIRAPVRGATSRTDLSASVAFLLFQSAPPCGGRPQRSPACGPSSQSVACFNPRPRAGGDSNRISDARRRAAVSIRAPVRGATWDRAAGSDLLRWLFQSAPPCGGRPTPSIEVSISQWFQSAPPCGGRPAP